MRNNLPHGIIDEEIPQDVYHHTLNPNPSTDQQYRTEEGEEQQPEQDSGMWTSTLKKLKKKKLLNKDTTCEKEKQHCTKK